MRARGGYCVTVLAALILVGYAAGAGAAVTADHADDVCGPTVDPCNVNQTVDVVNGSTLDFGLRTVSVGSGGVFDFGSGSGEILCGDFLADRSVAAIIAKAGGSGAFVEVEARRACSDDNLMPCLHDGNCVAGTCSVGSGIIDYDAKITGNADPAALIIFRSAGNTTVSKLVNLQGTTGDSDGGQFEIRSFQGSVNLDGKVDVTAGQWSTGGDVQFDAGVDVNVNENIDANGGDFDGGNVEVDAGNDANINDDVLASSITGEGSGGFIEFVAGRDVKLTGVGAGNKTVLSTNGHMGIDNFGGDGGTQEFLADRDVSLGSFTRIEGNGAMPDALGFDMFLTAGRDILLGGEIKGRGLGLFGAGGSALIESEGDTEFTAGGMVDLIGGEDGGGVVEVFAEGDFVFAGGIDVSASNNGSGGSAFIVAAGAATVSGTMETDGGLGFVSDGEIDIYACSVHFTATAELDNRATDGSNNITAIDTMVFDVGSQMKADASTGENNLVHRHASTPPVTNGTITPAPGITVDGTLVGCPVCGNGEVEAGETCDDSNTTNDDGCTSDCQSEGCIDDTPGYPGVALCDDLIDCTVDACVSDACEHVTDDSACDDGNLCTDNTCVAETGCSAVNNTDPCNDSLFCTISDTCSGGSCSDTDPRDCSDGVGCTVDSCDEDGDTCANWRDDAACSDGLYCTGVETCDPALDCQSGTAVDCSHLDDQCNDGTCNDEADQCEATNINEGQGCDDTVACTENDQCGSGVCAGTDIDCSHLDDQCAEGVCNENGGQCEASPANEGQNCDDGLYCTVGDVCDSGSCTVTARDCGDGVDCTTDGCDDEGDTCTNVADDGACDDGLHCTGEETCDAVNDCQVGTPVDCSHLDQPCSPGFCDEDADSCDSAPGDEGGPCDDGLFCTDDDNCTGGVCSGPELDCSHLDDQCNFGTCDDDQDQCVATPGNEEGGCDDGLFCTESDACTGGACSGPEPDCSHLDDQCNTGTCDEGQDQCVGTPINEGGGCDDGFFCTDSDVCTAGSCGGPVRDCGDGVDCTVDGCDDEGDACTNTPADIFCDDTFHCNGDETCDAVLGCQDGDDIDCTHLDDACNDGVCNEDGDACEIETANEGGICDDGEACTDDDECTAGVCEGTEIPPGCGQCSNGVTEDGEECDDGNLEPLDGCDGSCQLEDSVSQVVAEGGTVDTDADEGDGATPEDPVESSVTSPNAGTITITITGAVGVGFTALGQSVVISAPAATAGDPLVITIRLDASVVPVGEDETTVQLFRDGVLVPDCLGSSVAIPDDPCISARTLLGDGDVELTALSSTASTWNLGVSCGDGNLNDGEECDDGNLDQADGCRNDCTICGNNSVDGTEECDDGNINPGDGCDASCLFEAVTTTSTTLAAVCGDGFVQGNEECDDGDEEFATGDYCAGDCTVVPCGKPTNTASPRPTTTDALFTLQAGVGKKTCDQRVCNANGDSKISATDALLILNKAVGKDVELTCPTEL